MVAMFLLLIFSYDVWFYFSHILLHHFSLFYSIIHKKHHMVNPNEMRFTDAYEGHIVESILQGFGYIFPLLLFEINTMTLLFSLVFLNIRGMIRHDSRLVSIFGNNHILHHANPKINFGRLVVPNKWFLA